MLSDQLFEHADVSKFLAAVLLLMTSVLSACSSECGSTIYPDFPDLLPGEAAQHGLLEDNNPPGPVTDVTQGRGTVAQPGRQLRVRVSAFDTNDQYLGEAELEYLFPAFDKAKFETLAWGIDSGEVPQFFSGLVSGMRVGGEREFLLPSIGDYANQEPRIFRARDSRDPVLEVPRDEVRVQVELLAVCKPEFCLKTTYSILAAPKQTLTERSCR